MRGARDDVAGGGHQTKPDWGASTMTVSDCLPPPFSLDDPEPMVFGLRTWPHRYLNNLLLSTTQRQHDSRVHSRTERPNKGGASCEVWFGFGFRWPAHQPIKFPTAQLAETATATAKQLCALMLGCAYRRRMFCAASQHQLQFGCGMLYDHA